MKAVAVVAQNFQGKIDLRWSENLHGSHFNCHVERSRDISRCKIQRVRFLDSARNDKGS